MTLVCLHKFSSKEVEIGVFYGGVLFILYCDATLFPSHLTQWGNLECHVM